VVPELHDVSHTTLWCGFWADKRLNNSISLFRFDLDAEGFFSPVLEPISSNPHKNLKQGYSALMDRLIDDWLVRLWIIFLF